MKNFHRKGEEGAEGGGKTTTTRTITNGRNSQGASLCLFFPSAPLRFFLNFFLRNLRRGLAFFFQKWYIFNSLPKGLLFVTN
jgi:hypothetical protein